MVTVKDLREMAGQIGYYDPIVISIALRDAADVIEDLCNQIDGTVRVAADALKRIEEMENR